MNHLEFGKAGEQAAVQFLKRKRYKIVTTNYRAQNAEIDIIAYDKKTLCFIEVKTRSGIAFGAPSEAVGFHKRQKIISAAAQYLAYNTIDSEVRFDVVEVYASVKNGRFALFDIRLIQNAFDNA